NTRHAYDYRQITSILSGVLERLGQQQESHDAIAACLKKLQRDRPDDVSILIALCLLDLKAPQPDAFGKSAAQLEEWIKAHPAAALKDDSPEFAPNVKLQQRALRITYWLVARECLQREGLHPIGERLYRHALEVASLSTEYSFQHDICHEAGLIAFYAGDKSTAEARWSDEIDLIRSRAKLSPPLGPEAIEKREQPSLTVAEFVALQELAERAITREMPNLSFKAARAAFRAGYPVYNEVSQEGTVRNPRNSSDPLTYKMPAGALSTWALTLTPRWQMAKFPPQEIYQTLLEAVLPSERPNQILCMMSPLPTTEDGVLESVGALLVKQAVLVNQVDDLRERIKARSLQPGCEFFGELLLAMLDIEARDKNSALGSLHALCQASAKDPSEHTTELLCHVVLPALDNDDLALAIDPLLPRVFTHINIKAGGLKHERIGGMLVRMAQQQYRLGNANEGKRLLDQYQLSQEVRYNSEVESSYNAYIRKRALFRTAQEFAKAGRMDDALDRLAKSADMPAYDQFKDSSDARNGVAVYQLLMATKPEERYRLLSAWTLAVAGKNTIRVMDNFGPDDASPAVLAEKFMQLIRIHPLRQSQVLMRIAPLEIVNQARSAKVLVQAAIEADKLQDLETEVRVLADQKVDRARELLLLIRLAMPEEVAK
ncbi:MAG: tetratricopeptide repeat protein, partial [Planctomycetaceae bacterium]|nr:tetratricopeptide repeat protein [Planctomycetaceae bacterium]